jgi:hypothetical protein
MNATENNVATLRACCFLREFVGVAAKIGEANDFIALVVVSKHDYLTAEGPPGLSNTLVHRVIRKDEIVLQTANCRCGCQVVLAFSSKYGPMPTCGVVPLPWNGVVESLQRLS